MKSLEERSGVTVVTSGAEGSTQEKEIQAQVQVVLYKASHPVYLQSRVYTLVKPTTFHSLSLGETFFFSEAR